jgi:uncharacterized protein YdhG (YjbR/CyaY superfamily)
MALDQNLARPAVLEAAYCGLRRGRIGGRLSFGEWRGGMDQYLAALPEGSRVALERIRKLIRAAAPEAIEMISYQMPAFRDHGRLLVAYGAFKDHCSLFPASTRVMEAHRDELEPYYAGKGTIHFQADGPLPAALVTKLVKARIEENAARRHR